MSQHDPPTPADEPEGKRITLAGDLWLPDGTPRAAVVVNSATAVVRRYYAAFARHLVSRGFAVLTYDYRGIGGSRPPSLRGFPGTMTDWVLLDVPAALAFLRQRFPEARQLAVGHSFGGQALALAPGAADLHGGILVASQSGYWGNWPGISRWQMFFYWHFLFPLVTRLVGHLPGRLGIGEDLPRGVALDWARWCRHPEYAFAHLDGAVDRAASFQAPLLALSFADDPYAPRRAVEALVERFTTAEVEHRHLEPRATGQKRIGHFGFFRSSHRELWTQIEDWLSTER